MTIELDPDIAFEYLDDGGLLVCYLPTGDYYQLSNPAGMIWQLIWETRDFASATTGLAHAMKIDLPEAREGMRAFLTEMHARRLVNNVVESE
jgi:hypothetical protein